MAQQSNERTLAIIKPDSFRKKVCGKIIAAIEDNGLSIIGIKVLHLSRNRAEEFYAVHAEKPFYPMLIDFMVSGNIMVLALEGENAIQRWRNIMGATNPANADEGTLRKLYGTNVTNNACHGSDAPETAAVELAFFFENESLVHC